MLSKLICAAAVAAAFVLVLVATVEAAPEGPVVAQVVSDPEGYGASRAKAGGSVRVLGERLGGDGAKVALTFDKQPLALEEASASAVRFRVPADAKLGRHEVALVVTPGGTARFTLEVVARDEKVERDAENGGGPAGVGVPIKEPPPLLTITRFDLDGSVASAAVVATTRLPDDLEVDASLGFKLPQGALTVERVIETCRVKAKKGIVEVRFGPYPGKELLLGEYFVVLEFELKSQPRAALGRARWPAALTADERRFWSETRVKDYRATPGAENGPAQEKEHRERYKTVSERATALAGEVERVAAAAGKSLFRRATALDEEAWRAFVARRLAPDEVEAARKDERFVTKGFALEGERLAEHLKKAVLVPLEELARVQAVLGERFLGLRDPEAHALATQCVAEVQGLVRVRAKELYDNARLEVPELIRDRLGGHAVSAPSRAHAKLLAKRLLERVE